jgi:hypothetical protein
MTEDANAENLSFEAQKGDRRHEAMLKRIHALRPVLSRQGVVKSTWRTYRGTRLGPYYRLVYRLDGRARSCYLGRSAALAEKVRALVAQWQKPLREHRLWVDLRKRSLAALRAHKAVWAQELARAGFRLKGYEIRGLRRLSTRALDAAIVALESAPITSLDDLDLGSILCSVAISSPKPQQVSPS